MFKHIVMFRIKKDLDVERVSVELCEKLSSMPNYIEEILSIEIGRNQIKSSSAFDVVLITTHKDRTDYERYQIHEYHQQIKSYVVNIVEDRALVDYEVE